MPKTKQPRSIKILFIGNSFTQRNNLPGMLTELAAERGLRIEHDLLSRGGASLRTHWNAGQAAQSIKAGGYDYVALQEQSTLPVKNPQRMAENIRLFDNLIERTGSKTVLYMTWARQHLPKTQQAITNAYTALGRELGAIVVPAGLAWQSFQTDHDTPPLYDRDQSHPTPAGSYLAACVFLAALFEENPVGLQSAPAGLAPADRLLLQRTAWASRRLRAR